MHTMMYHYILHPVLLLILTCDGTSPMILYPGKRAAPSGNDKTCSVRLFARLPAYQMFYKKIYASTNGLISLENKYTSSTPEVFSEKFNKSEEVLIAPLWSKFDLSAGGSKLYCRKTSQINVLNAVAGMIYSKNPRYRYYFPSYALIFTWKGVPLSSNTSLRYTFQVILSSDYGRSFATFIYNTPKRIREIDKFQDYVIGFNAGDRRRYVNLFTNSTPERINIFRIDRCNITSVHDNDVSYNRFGPCVKKDLTEKGFLPYGLPFSRELGPPQANRISFGPIRLPLALPFRYFDTFETTLYISTSGVITFQRQFPSSLKRARSLTNLKFLGHLVAPFWAGFNLNAGGQIYYRIATDNMTMAQVAKVIGESNMIFNNSYRPALAVIVTWERVPLAFRNFVRVFTFQCVLSTDGRMSFATFLYEEPEKLNFSGYPRHTVGFYTAKGMRSLNVMPESLKGINVFRIDGSCIVSVVPGDTCDSHSEVYTCDSESGTSVSCLCDFEDPSSNCLDLFPFGERYGDTIFPTATTKTVGPLSLYESIYFFQREQKSFYISTNGIISFKLPFKNFRVKQFPSTSVPVIAPLWGDINFRDYSRIYYRITQNESTLAHMAKLITEENPAFSEYHPTLCAVVTWSFAIFSASKERHTFQAVLSTDGKTSFAAFLYADTAGLKRAVSENRAQIGFDAGDESRGATVLDGNMQQDSTLKTVNIYRIDGNCITSISDGEVCGLNSTSLECEDDRYHLKALSCLCEPGVYGNMSLMCQRDFFPFGIGEGDTVGPREDDASTDLIPLKYPIIFYQREQKNFSISTNGLISFQMPFNSYNPSSFPRTSPPILPLVAPIWADFNFKSSGTIYYGVHENDDISDHITSMITRSNSDFLDYTPTLAIIVTWFQSSLFRSYIKVTAQAALVTDGNISFALFLYGNITDIENSRFPVQVGFDAGDTRRSGLIVGRINRNNHKIGKLLDENTQLLFRIDGHCVVPVKNDKCGLSSVPMRCEVVEREYTSTACLCNNGVSSMGKSCLEFFQFGERAGDATVPSIDVPSSSLSRRLTLSTPIVFFREEVTVLKLSIYGFITLRSTFSLNFEEDLPVFGFSSITLISPLWIMSYIDATLYYRIAIDHTTLAQVEDMITDFNSNLTDFHPKLAVVSTWLLHDRQLDTSYQSILATDGNVSFAIFLYEHPNRVVTDIQTREVGFYSGGLSREDVVLNNGSLNHVLKRINIYRIDGACITSASPGDVCGLNSVTAECTSFSASNCTCNLGYQSKDELVCENIDECEQGVCSENATCVDLPGSFQCECKEGFDGNGFTCYDTDECATAPCSTNALCVNTIGSFQCVCNYGFKGDGVICKDTCADSNCSRDATCRNTENSFKCECNQNFEGDGFTCSVHKGPIIGGIMGSILGLILLIVPVIVIIVVKAKSMEKKIRVMRKTLREQEKENDSDYRSINLKNITVQSSFKHNLPKSLIIPSCNLKLGKTLGQGEFGVVYKGFIRNGFNDTISDTVAVKTLKGFVQEELVTDLLRECARMSEFDHPNILTLKGVCLDGGPAPYIIMPFMANGSLLSYLKEERELLIVESSNENMDDIRKRLLDMCIQVGKGMEYLTSKRVIHRDLAARNCMIDINLAIKVADFGLSESIDVSKEYFRQGQDSAIKLPIKWLAPESINDGVFSEKSDVWAYGVTCWEIFSGGKTPYPGIHPVDLPRQLEMGLRMEKPLNEACDQEMYSVMMRCWELRAESRPSFAELVIRLSTLLTAVAEYMDLMGSTMALRNVNNSMECLLSDNEQASDQP